MKKKTTKKTARVKSKSKTSGVIYNIEQEFLIITGGGFVVLVVLMAILFR